ncbi:MAG: hypothetical protein JWN50_562 [Parcubacteria group bacterium]|nr:hypothetical protein [Parcubacteria group bacterium]
MTSGEAITLYRETRKARRPSRESLEHARLMSEAKREYERMLAEPPKSVWPLGARARPAAVKKNTPSK